MIATGSSGNQPGANGFDGVPEGPGCMARFLVHLGNLDEETQLPTTATHWLPNLNSSPLNRELTRRGFRV